jgi:cytochrome c2
MRRLLAVALLVAGAGACGGSSGASKSTTTTTPFPVSGDPVAGQAAIAKYGCTNCHQIPGFKKPASPNGPPLAGIRNAATIGGGVLPFSEDNLIKWIENPQAVAPGTSMPNLNVTPDDARNIAAYLLQH